MSKRKVSGFTLVELVVTMAVIAIVSSLAVSITTGVRSIRTENEDKISVADMNNIFTSAWGAESYAYPQTAIDIKAILYENGYVWSEPRQGNAEYWFDSMSGKVLLGKMSSDCLEFDDGTSVPLEPNESIISPDGFIKGYVYLGQKYRAYLDEFRSIDADGEAETAAEELSELLSRPDVPIFIRKSLRTLAEHAIFIGESNAVAFTGIAPYDDSDEWFDFAPLSEATDVHTIAIFTKEKIDVKGQFKNSYIKSVYIPCDTAVSFEENAFDDTWVQRLLVNDSSVEYGELINQSSKGGEGDFDMKVSVLHKYYPSELPEYDLMTLSVEKYLKLYDGKKADSDGFAAYYKNELLAKSDIEELYNGFYRLRRPSDRRYVLKVREDLYGNITMLKENLQELEELAALVGSYRDYNSELLLKGLNGSPENYSLWFLSDIRSSKKGWSVLDNYDKLFVGEEADGVVLKMVRDGGKFTAESKGNGYITLFGTLGGEIKFDFTVGGAYESVSIDGVAIGASRTLKSVSGDKIEGEYYGTLDKDGKGVVIVPNSAFTGEFVHSSEKLVVDCVDADVAFADNGRVTVKKTSSDVTVKIRVSSYLDPSIDAILEVPLKGNACNVFSSNDFGSVKTDSYGVAFHSDVRHDSSYTWEIPSGRTVYGNGYTFTNAGMTAETMATATSRGMFRFPAAVTVYGSVRDLKIVVKTGSEIGLGDKRFGAIACAEESDTEATLGNIKLVDVIYGNIKGEIWSGQKKNIFGKVTASYGPITIVSKRLAAVRVYGSGSLTDCFVVGGQYGVHLIGSGSQNGVYNLDNVYVKNSLAANIYISDNDGAKQFINIRDVRVYNELNGSYNMQPAFPILIEPKVVAVSSKKYGHDRVYGYGLSLKYCYGLIQNKLTVNLDNFYAYNKIDKNTLYQMLYDNMAQNSLMLRDELRKIGIDYFKNNTNDIVDRFELPNNFSVPIYYGEQCYSQIYDQQYTFSDIGLNKGVAGKNDVKVLSGFEFIKGYNSPKRAAKGFNLAGSNELALSAYVVQTNDGGTWYDPKLR